MISGYRSDDISYSTPTQLRHTLCLTNIVAVYSSYNGDGFLFDMRVLSFVRFNAFLVKAIQFVIIITSTTYMY